MAKLYKVALQQKLESIQDVKYKCSVISKQVSETDNEEKAGKPGLQSYCSRSFVQQVNKGLWMPFHNFFVWCGERW